MEISSSVRILSSTKGLGGRDQDPIVPTNSEAPEKMKLKQFEGLFGDLEQFSYPKVELEQYPTGLRIASRMLFTRIHMKT
ncbi:hypothetical protein EUTSA_v10002738mg [Eutrema salsugineum]|uniref:Uncharacterized protein n=1 Tax=Eutrema salsugineum TaxID=72664 RepID=V4KZS7_EUTSA|nr:hypothetical protein EUTSA_v10002738mg [Eutrema salsugineum]